MNYREFETWLEKLSPSDRKFLESQAGWKKDHERAQKARSLSEGFVGRTMEILEGGSESET